MDESKEKINNSIKQLHNWIMVNNYKGYEPFDGLSSKLRFLTFHNWFAERVLQQLVLRCPFHIRPLMGIKTKHSTKGMGYFAKGFIHLWNVTKDEKYKIDAKKCLDWLIENQNKNYSGACWGNHFDYASRGFQLPKSVPTQVWVGLIGQAFLDGYKAFSEEKYLEVAVSACDFIIKDLPRTQFNNSFCISYVPFKKILIHNANMIGAALLARTYSITRESELYEISKKAMQFACDCQMENGSWYYGEESKFHWIDNWHTAYNLDSLKCFIESTGDTDFEENLKIGYNFFKNNFFYKDGKPKYYYDKLRWVDIQCASQSIDTFCYFSKYDKEALSLAKKIACWTIDNMQDKSGYFYYRNIGWKNVKVPMLHWGQATMLSALGHLLEKLEEEVINEN